MRKFLIICAIMAALMCFFVIATSAAEINVTMDFIDRIEVTEDNERKDIVHKLFDGDIKSKGIDEDGISDPEKQNAWMGGQDDFIEIFFKDSITITGMKAYQTGNWTWATFEFYDANHELVYVVYGGDFDHRTVANSNPYGPEGVPHDIFIPGDAKEGDPMETIENVKSVKIIVTSYKWSRHSTYTVSELEIKCYHEHEYNTFDSYIEKPTCALPGVGKYNCFCGDSCEYPEQPTGNHYLVDDIVFRNGFDNPGYLGRVCETCDTQDYHDPANEIPALFKVLGYSANEKTLAITFGIAVNYDGIAVFNALSEIDLHFGITAASRAAYAEGNPIVFGAESLEAAASTVVLKDCTSSEYSIITYSINKIPENHKDTEIILCAYVFDGEDIFYVGNNSTLDVETVTYNSVLESAKNNY